MVNARLAALRISDRYAWVQMIERMGLTDFCHPHFITRKATLW